MEAKNHFLATKHQHDHNSNSNNNHHYHHHQQQEQPYFHHIMTNTSDEGSFDHHTSNNSHGNSYGVSLMSSLNQICTQVDSDTDITSTLTVTTNSANPHHNSTLYKSREMSPMSFLDIQSSPSHCDIPHYHLNLLTSDSTDVGKGDIIIEPSSDDGDKKSELIRLHDEIKDLNQLRQGIVALNGIKTMDDSWHEHTHWKFVYSDDEGNCVECENEFQKGDLISVGKRIVDIGNNVQQSVQGHDKLHWNCSKFWSRRKDEPNAASSFGELVTKIIGGVDRLKQIEDWDLLDVDSKIKVFKHAKLEIDQQLVDAQKEVQKKRKRELLEECRIEDLDTKSFRDLQSLAKRLRIKANQKKDDLISSLRAALTSEDD